MQELEKILEEIEEEQRSYEADHAWNYARGLEYAANIIRKHMNDGWIPVEERLPEEKRANYEVTFINECGYEEHGFARWYDGVLLKCIAAVLLSPLLLAAVGALLVMRYEDQLLD